MRRIKPLSVLVLLALLLSAGVRKATADPGGYDTRSQCYCPNNGTVKGDSWLNWWDMPPSSWGRTYGILYHQVGGEWLPEISDIEYAEGCIGNALVHLEWAPLSGNWWMRGYHTASFFSGTKVSNGYCSCS